MSEEAKHTPGPWRIGDACNTVFGPPCGLPPQRIERIADTSRTKNRRANTVLIAAAPELLEACHDAIVGLSAMLDDNETAAERLAAESLALLAIESAEAAIEKAQGK